MTIAIIEYGPYGHGQFFIIDHWINFVVPEIHNFWEIGKKILEKNSGKKFWKKFWKKSLEKMIKWWIPFIFQFSNHVEIYFLNSVYTRPWIKYSKTSIHRASRRKGKARRPGKSRETVKRGAVNSWLTYWEISGERKMAGKSRDRVLPYRFYQQIEYKF